jgi:hypothetical protein
MARIRPGLVLALLLLQSVAGLTVLPQSRTATVSETKQSNLREAGAIADRIVASLRGTLNFGPILREFFVRDPKLRRSVILANDYDDALKGSKEFTQELLERRYIANMTAIYAVFEYRMLYPELDLPSGIDAGGPLLNCPPHGGNSADRPDFRLIKQCIELNEGKIKLFRPYLNAEVFARESTKQTFLELEKEQAKDEVDRKLPSVPRVQGGLEKLGIRADTPVYVVRRETRDYYFLEEQESLRLFYIDFLPNFQIKLF